MTSEAEIAWAAGLYEGEGSAFLGGVQCQPRLQLEMVDEDIVRRFALALGSGNVRSYSSRGRNRSSATWQWSVQRGEDVLAVVALLLPHLGSRRTRQLQPVWERAQEIVASRDRCKRGHDLNDPEHLYVHRKTGKRGCRTCRRAASRRASCRVA